MRTLLVAVVAACAAILPAGGAAAADLAGDFPLGCTTPYASCPGTKPPHGQQLCIYYDGGSFCFDIWP